MGLGRNQASGAISQITQQAIANMIYLRRKHHLSAQKLSDALKERYDFDISRATLTNLENGRRGDFMLTEVMVLADFFQVSLEWFTTLRGKECVICHDEPPAGFSCNACGLGI